MMGVPALIDNLAIVYNKQLFAQAGIPLPTADWTWNDFGRRDKLTDPAKKQFGWAFPADASEDTVWRFEAMLWEAGGDILNADDTHAAFDSPAGLKAMTARDARQAQLHLPRRRAAMIPTCSTRATSAWCSPGRGTCRIPTTTTA